VSETPPDWVTAKPAWAPVHNISETPGKIPRPDFKQFDIWRGRLVEMVLQQIVTALKGILMPGKAFGQLQAWGDGIRSLFGGVDFGSLPSPDVVWKNIIETIMNPLGVLKDALARSDLSQLLDILRGTIVTPASEAMQEVKDWWNGLGQQLQDGAENVQDFFDNIWRGFTRQSGSGKSAADVANAAATTSTQADTALQVGEWNNAVLGIRNTSPFGSGMDPTAWAMFDQPTPVTQGGDFPHLAVTAGVVPIAFWIAPNDAKRGSVQWIGKGATDITSFYVDVYRVNVMTGQKEFLHTSPDQVPNLSANWKSMRYDMPTTPTNLRVDTAHGDVLAFGFRLSGSGSHLIACKHYGDLTDPTQTPPRPAAQRTGVGTVAMSSLTWAGDVPWVALGIVEGDVEPPYFAPRTTPFTEVGTFEYPVPTWANFVDGAYGAAGGGGSGGNVVAGGYGEGGKKGQRIGETLVRGVDFPDIPNATITITIGNGGPGGDGSGDGGKGGDTYRHAIPGGKAELRAVGGAPGTNNFVGYDQGPARGEPGGTFTWNGVDYAGGVGGSVGVARTGGAGGSPSAGGGGGSGGTYGISWDGGRGGRGDAHMTARQS
jgi:hypothetical protein